LKERDVVYVTTLGVNQGYREVFEQRFKPTDLERRLGDAKVLTTLDDLADLSLWKGAFWKRWFLRWPDPRIAFWNLRRLHEAGITVAAGSDAGNIVYPLYTSRARQERSVVPERHMTNRRNDLPRPV
jgi:hypothetical protein